MMGPTPAEQRAANTGPAAPRAAEHDAATFRFPDWSAPLDLHEHLQRTPAEQTTKGMFMQRIVEAARAASGVSPVEEDFVPFHNYPMRAWMELLVRCAELAHPDAPVREGIRRLGHLSYGTVASSSAGQVMFELAGRDIGGLLRFIPRYFRVTGRGGIADVSFLAEQHVILQLRDIWDFPDAYHVGALEGVLRGVGAEGQVKIRTIGASSVDFEIVWR